MPRYTTPYPNVYGPNGWRNDRSHEVEDFYGNTVRINVEVANLTDTRTGHTYRDGAYRVEAFVVAARSSERVRVSKNTRSGMPPRKNFKGESAWNAVDRYVNDLEWTLRRGTVR